MGIFGRVALKASLVGGIVATGLATTTNGQQGLVGAQTAAGGPTAPITTERGAVDEQRGFVLSQPESGLEEVRAAALRLLEEPEDPEANRIAGWYLCVRRSQWERGLALLARGADARLAELARQDLADPADKALELAIGDGWYGLALREPKASRARMALLGRAEHWYERVLPKLSGTTFERVRERMSKQPLLLFDGSNPPGTGWVSDNLRFWANHGREGPGRWAHYGSDGVSNWLAANRAGWVETLGTYPPDGVMRYRIDAVITSDNGPGAALEFAGIRMLFNDKGISLDDAWHPQVVYPIERGRPLHYVIDVAPCAVSFTINGKVLGTYETDRLRRSRVALRGWEGHLRCDRLVIWAVPEQ